MDGWINKKRERSGSRQEGKGLPACLLWSLDAMQQTIHKPTMINSPSPRGTSTATHLATSTCVYRAILVCQCNGCVAYVCRVVERNLQTTDLSPATDRSVPVPYVRSVGTRRDGTRHAHHITSHQITDRLQGRDPPNRGREGGREEGRREEAYECTRRWNTHTHQHIHTWSNYGET